jgi:hypothetical protein
MAIAALSHDASSAQQVHLLILQHVLQYCCTDYLWL